MVSATQRDCHAQRLVELPGDGTPRYLGNVVTEESGCGGADSPWVVTARPGQRVNVTVLDFGVGLRTAPQDPDRGYTPKICRCVQGFLRSHGVVGTACLFAE